jgi:hypothetical protein
MLLSRIAVLCFAGSGVARSLKSLPKHFDRRQESTTTVDAPTAQSTACGDIISTVDNEGTHFLDERMFAG